MYCQKKDGHYGMVCDRFHFATGHTDKWCKKNCNPYKTQPLLCNQRNNIKVIEGKFFKR